MMSGHRGRTILTKNSAAGPISLIVKRSRRKKRAEARTRFEARSRDRLPRLTPLPPADAAPKTTGDEDQSASPSDRLDSLLDDSDLPDLKQPPAAPPRPRALTPPKTPPPKTPPSVTPQPAPVPPKAAPKRSGESLKATEPKPEIKSPEPSVLPTPESTDSGSRQAEAINRRPPLRRVQPLPEPVVPAAAASLIRCQSCGGCVDRDGPIGVTQFSKRQGIGIDAPSACQCWRCPQSAPFNVYGPGNYAGPARLAPIAQYRLRAGDQVQLTFLIKTVRTDGPYRLVVGDELLIESEADEKLTRGTLDSGLEIQPDGTITLRFIGQVHAAGQTIAQLRKVLEQMYTQYYEEPSIDVTPVATGNVARQIREAISGSEGFNPQQTEQTITPEGTIRLPRIGAVPAQGLTLSELKREINYRYDAIDAGLEIEPVLLEQAPHSIYVLGEVVTPGQFDLTRPTTLLGSLALAGGYVPGANLRQIVVFRRGYHWELIATTLDVRAALLGKDSRAIDEIWLQDGDVVIVPPMPIRLFDRFVDQVFTQGIYGIVPFAGFGYTFGNNN